jgi:class 3 adenylate cyclase
LRPKHGGRSSPSGYAWHCTSAQQRDDDYFGQPLNRVARLCSAGHGGQVLLSNAAQELVRDALPKGIELRDLGEHRLKDLIRPERIFQLVAPTSLLTSRRCARWSATPITCRLNQPR